MEVFLNFLVEIKDSMHRERTEEVLSWIKNKYPQLKTEMKWNQPMFTDHGTFIIGFSVSKKHLAVAPESVAITFVEDAIVEAGYDYTKQLIRILWSQPVDYKLLEKLIEFNIHDKENSLTFWRK